MPQLVVCVQARLGSRRYPQKILAPFCGVSMLSYQVRRFTELARYALRVLVPEDEMSSWPWESDHCPLYALSMSPIPVSADDVLGRFAWYAQRHFAPGTLIVRICGDCPLLCPFLLGTLLIQWAANPGLAYLGMGPGWPDGLGDYDLFTQEALCTANAMGLLPSEREHVSPAFWRHGREFPQMTCPAPAWVRARQWPKLSVDTPEDLAYVEQVTHAVTAQHGPAYTWIDVLQTIEATPALHRAPEPMNAAYMAQVAQERGGKGMTWEDIRYS